jgi:hypothetical protein
LNPRQEMLANSRPSDAGRALSGFLDSSGGHSSSAVRRQGPGAFDMYRAASYLSSSWQRPSDKGKPGESRGRKATGPRLLRDASFARHEGPQDRRLRLKRRSSSTLRWRTRSRRLNVFPSTTLSSSGAANTPTSCLNYSQRSQRSVLPAGSRTEFAASPLLCSCAVAVVPRPSTSQRFSRTTGAGWRKLSRPPKSRPSSEGERPPGGSSTLIRPGRASRSGAFYRSWLTGKANKAEALQ